MVIQFCISTVAKVNDGLALVGRKILNILYTITMVEILTVTVSGSRLVKLYCIELFMRTKGEDVSVSRKKEKCTIEYAFSNFKVNTQ